MNTMKLIYPLALALAVSLAGAGCKHSPTKLTRLPGSPNAPASPTGDGPVTTVPPFGQPINPEPPITGVNNPPVIAAPGQHPTSEDWVPGPNFIEDRATLAANTVHFAFDSAAVKSGEQANIQAVVNALTTDPSVKLLIEGHCDERGTEEYNRSLGERRALALREEIAKSNIDDKRIRTISFGKDKPADPGHTEEAFKKNRRGEFVLYHPKPGV